MFFGKAEKDPGSFWREYEEKTGEKVLARDLGQYVSGWEKFDSRNCGGIWGLVMATSGGFRFHHFPQQNWIEVLGRLSGREEQKEKTIFIPNEKIISARIVKETKWWKKLIASPSPKLVINYLDGEKNERRLFLEAEFKSGGMAEILNAASSVL